MNRKFFQNHRLKIDLKTFQELNIIQWQGLLRTAEHNLQLIMEGQQVLLLLQFLIIYADQQCLDMENLDLIAH
jgi:hypothetical protein